MIPNIIRDGVTFTFNDGDVSEIRTRIATELDYDAMPSSLALYSLLYDFNGVTKIITLSGGLTNTGSNRLTVGSAITIDEQRKYIESCLDGLQSTAIFRSNYTSSYNGSDFEDSPIMFSTIEFNERTNEPNILFFTITLFVGGY